VGTLRRVEISEQREVQGNMDVRSNMEVQSYTDVLKNTEVPSRDPLSGPFLFDAE
jgi:hypothetical protein